HADGSRRRVVGGQLAAVAAVSAPQRRAGRSGDHGDAVGGGALDMLDRRRLGLITLDYSSPQECLDAVIARELGFLEFYIDGMTAEDVRSFSSQCERAGVRISALSTLSKLGSAETEFPAQ